MDNTTSELPMNIKALLLATTAALAIASSPAFAGGGGGGGKGGGYGGHPMGGGYGGGHPPMMGGHPPIINNNNNHNIAYGGTAYGGNSTVNFAPIISNAVSAASYGSGWGIAASIAVPLILNMINQSQQVAVAPQTRVVYRSRYVPVAPCDTERDPKSPAPSVCFNQERKVYESPGPAAMLPKYLAQLDRENQKHLALVAKEQKLLADASARWSKLANWRSPKASRYVAETVAFAKVTEPAVDTAGSAAIEQIDAVPVVAVESAPLAELTMNRIDTAFASVDVLQTLPAAKAPTVVATLN